MKINMKYWQSTEGDYSEKTFDKPLYPTEPNSAPEGCDYFTIQKEQEIPNSTDVLKVSLEDTQRIAQHLQFKGDVRESRTGNSWKCYRNPLDSVTFDLSAI